MASNDPHILVLIPLCNFCLHFFRVVLNDHLKTAKVTVCDFLGFVLPFSEITHFGRNQLPCCEDIPAAWLVRHQGILLIAKPIRQPSKLAILESHLLALVNSLDNCNFSQDPDWNFLRNPNPEKLPAEPS
jgi:hypothetical protein